MTKIFEFKCLPLAAVKLPLYPLHYETDQERLQQANAVALQGFNARPVLIDENFTIIDGAQTYAALYCCGIDKVNVLLVDGASDIEIRALRRALRILPNLNVYTENLYADLQFLMDSGYPIQPYVAGVVELFESLMVVSQNDSAVGLADDAAFDEA